MPTLRDIVNENVREGELYEKLDRNTLFCLWSLLPHPGGPTWRLQGSLQPRRDSVRSLGLRRCSAVRPYRKETLLPCLPWGTSSLPVKTTPHLYVVQLAADLQGYASARESDRQRRSLMSDISCLPFTAAVWLEIRFLTLR
jgi:hypothetical protein